MSYPTLISQRYTTSRGRVRCDTCHRTIARGTRYDATNVADMGTITTWRECPACQDARTHVDDWSGYDPLYDDPVPPELFHEWVDDVLDSYMAGVDDYIRCVGCRDDRYGEDLLTVTRDQLAQAAAEAQALDTQRPVLDDHAWAAFTWLMRTSSALHPQGIANVPKESSTP